MAANPKIRHELLAASDSMIEDAIQYADPMVLRGLLYQLTGDPEVRATRSKLVVTGFAQAPVVTYEDVPLLRRKAVEFLKRYRDSGAGDIDIGPKDRLTVSLGLTVGEEISNQDDLSLCLEELALDPFVRGLEWSAPPPRERLDNFSVTIIGAGLGGLTAALTLKRAGISYRMLEKNHGVGGTWHENRYPGARVDTPSRGYTNIFGVDFPYPNPFCGWEENQKYFDWVADTFDLRRGIEFGIEVRSLNWNETDGMWEIDALGPDGPIKLRSNAVITAVGFLNRPHLPDIEGAKEFTGPSWHTSRWPEGFDLKGRRIAVIGTGATGYQTIPEIALEAEHVVIFQRTPSWLFAARGYRSPFPPQVNWLDRNLPYHTNFSRHRTLFPATFAAITDIDPHFQDEHARSPVNKQLRESSIAFLQRKLRDPVLVAKMTPAYPVLGARPVIVDPEFSVLDAILQDNVTLVTDAATRIDRTGVWGGDGKHYEVDAIVYATGFHATEYLFPMTITGRAGQTIEALWKEGGARAHRFCMVPGFPNLFSLYGPNTNGGLGPGAFHELVVAYALQCMERLILEGKKSIEPKVNAYWDFAKRIDERNNGKVWSDSRVHSYYWTKHGRSAVMCPLTGTEIWKTLRHPEFDELTIR